MARTGSRGNINRTVTGRRKDLPMAGTLVSGGRRTGGPDPVLAILAALVVFSAVMLVRELIPYVSARREYAALTAMIDGSGTDAQQNGAGRTAAGGTRRVRAESPADMQVQAEEESADPLFSGIPSVDHASLARINPDYTAVLWFPALDLRYPVVHSRDNDEYLRRTFRGSYNASGCIFLDKDDPADLSALSSVIYGHNMKDGSMFGSLRQLIREPELIDGRPYFYLITPDSTLCYMICACYTTPVDSIVYTDVTDGPSYEAYVSAMRSAAAAQILRDADLSSHPRLVTLSTCYGSGHTHNFVVQGALCGTAPARQ